MIGWQQPSRHGVPPHSVDVWHRTWVPYLNLQYSIIPGWGIIHCPPVQIPEQQTPLQLCSVIEQHKPGCVLAQYCPFVIMGPPVPRMQQISPQEICSAEHCVTKGHSALHRRSSAAQYGLFWGAASTICKILGTTELLTLKAVSRVGRAALNALGVTDSYCLNGQYYCRNLDCYLEKFHLPRLH